jgi:hypothetical protein
MNLINVKVLYNFYELILFNKNATNQFKIVIIALV